MKRRRGRQDDNRTRMLACKHTREKDKMRLFYKGEWPKYSSSHTQSRYPMIHRHDGEPKVIAELAAAGGQASVELALAVGGQDVLS